MVYNCVLISLKQIGSQSEANQFQFYFGVNEPLVDLVFDRSPNSPWKTLRRILHHFLRPMQSCDCTYLLSCQRGINVSQSIRIVHVLKDYSDCAALPNKNQSDHFEVIHAMDSFTTINEEYVRPTSFTTECSQSLNLFWVVVHRHISTDNHRHYGSLTLPSSAIIPGCGRLSALFLSANRAQCYPDPLYGNRPERIRCCMHPPLHNPLSWKNTTLIGTTAISTRSPFLPKQPEN